MVKEKKEKLHLYVSSRFRKRLHALQKRTEADTLAEVLRRALSLYTEVLDLQDGDGRLIFEDAKGDETWVRVK